MLCHQAFANNWKTLKHLENIIIDLGSGHDTFNIQGSGAGTTSTVNSGAGNDTFNISSDAPGNNGNLDNILGDVHINAGSGNNSILLQDSNEMKALASCIEALELAMEKSSANKLLKDI